MQKLRRKRKFVDRDVQGRLVWAALRYWMLSVLVVSVLTLVGWLFVYPGIGTFISSGAAASVYMPMFITAIAVAALLVPVALFDVSCLSHRFAGPMVRVRKALDELSRGGDAGPLEFRATDYWHDVAEEYNKVRRHVLSLRSAASDRPTPSATAGTESAALAEPGNIGEATKLEFASRQKLN